MPHDPNALQLGNVRITELDAHGQPLPTPSVSMIPAHGEVVDGEVVRVIDEPGADVERGSSRLGVAFATGALYGQIVHQHAATRGWHAAYTAPRAVLTHFLERTDSPHYPDAGALELARHRGEWAVQRLRQVPDDFRYAASEVARLRAEHTHNRPGAVLGLAALTYQAITGAAAHTSRYWRLARAEGARTAMRTMVRDVRPGVVALAERAAHIANWAEDRHGEMRQTQLYGRIGNLAVTRHGVRLARGAISGARATTRALSEGWSNTRNARAGDSDSSATV